MPDHNQALQEAARDLADAQRALRAVGIILSASAFAIADAIEAQAKAKKQAKSAARKAALAAPAKTAQN